MQCVFEFILKHLFNQTQDQVLHSPCGMVWLVAAKRWTL